MESHAQTPFAQSEAVASALKLYTQLQTKAPDLVCEFETMYSSWMDLCTWLKETSPSPAAHTMGPDFDALVDLGPKIVPLVIYKLTSPDQFLAVDLYDMVEMDDAFKLVAERIINMNFVRSSSFRRASATWAQLRGENSELTFSGFFTRGEGYWDLVEMSPSIIASVMLEYYDHEDDWHHELLHELVHGETSRLLHFDTVDLFASWRDWFEHKLYKEAPKAVCEEQQFISDLEHGLL